MNAPLFGYGKLNLEAMGKLLLQGTAFQGTMLGMGDHEDVLWLQFWVLGFRDV